MTDPRSNNDDTALTAIRTKQTSAGYLKDLMTLRYQQAWLGQEAELAEKLRLGLVTDIYIKAWSYAVINKIFFWASILLALAVLLWPSISIIAPSVMDRPAVFESAVVQTTVTGLATAAFFIYSEYKGKQQSAENLMRYVIHSEEQPAEMSRTVIDELTRIDKGFSFFKAIPGTKRQ